jgi:hypothetical protein
MIADPDPCSGTRLNPDPTSLFFFSPYICNCTLFCIATAVVQRTDSPLVLSRLVLFRYISIYLLQEKITVSNKEKKTRSTDRSSGLGDNASVFC